MSNIFDFINRNLEIGQKDLDDILANPTSQEHTGYVRMRGMIECFLEQEIYISSVLDSMDVMELQLDLLENDRIIVNQRPEDVVEQYGSRNVYKFVPIPMNNFREQSGNHLEVELIDTTCNENFKNSIIKFYDFTQEISEFIISNEQLKHELHRRFRDYFNIPRKKMKSVHEIKVNELLEIFCTVEFQKYTETENENIFNSKPPVNQTTKMNSGSSTSFSFHVLAYKRISNYSPVRCPIIGYDGFFGEFLSPSITSEFLHRLIKYKYPYLKNISELYNIFIKYIAEDLCRKNYLLAEYILLYICNRYKFISEKDEQDLYNSTDSSVILQISMCDRDFVQKLNIFLHEHIPRVVWITLNNSLLNESRVTPSFDPDKDCFVTTVLQFPLMRNLVLIDETALEEGELTNEALENLSNIASLVNFGVVNYGFSVYQVPIRNEANIIILTNGNSSILCEKCDIKIPLNYLRVEKIKLKSLDDLKRIHEVSTKNKNEILSTFKLYISIVSSCQETLEFDDSTREHIAEEFVRVRQKQKIQDQVRPTILRYWLTLARTHALLNGEKILNRSRFKEFMKLEMERLEVDI